MTNPANPAGPVVVIRGRGRVSALGLEPVPSLEAAASPFTCHATGVPVAALPAAAETAVAELRRRQPAYRQLDRTVLLALLAARQATAQAGWLPLPASVSLHPTRQHLQLARQLLHPARPHLHPARPHLHPDRYLLHLNRQHLQTDRQHLHPDRYLLQPDRYLLHPDRQSLHLDRQSLHLDRELLQLARQLLQPTTDNQQPTTQLAVSIGSSRGATERLEEFHAGFLAEGNVPAAASPLTTLGNVASWVAYDAGQDGGAALSHSSTCSSAFQALGNAVAWLKAGMADRFLAGGTEAPLTAFTLAQMRAIGIYSPLAAADWPCRPGAGRPSTFVLGEGAAVFALERASRATLAAEAGPVFVLEGVGFGFEAIGSKTGLSPEGRHFQQAMRQALTQAHAAPETIDAVVLHSPGTPAGDAAERAALRTVFGENAPLLLSNKWLLGHTLGASAALSLDFALHVLETQQWPTPPFATDVNGPATRPVRRILVNAAGFGGNAASVVVAQL